MTLQEFIHVRILEDEDTAYRARHRQSFWFWRWQWWGLSVVDYKHLLASCTARRRILQMAMGVLGESDPPADDRTVRAFRSGSAVIARNALKAIAEMHKDHPEYKPEWRP